MGFKSQAVVRLATPWVGLGVLGLFGTSPQSSTEDYVEVGTHTSKGKMQRL